MRLNQPIECMGYFWLPQNEEGRVPGTLFITDGGNIRLHLLGIIEKKERYLKNAFNSSNPAGYDFPRIFGALEDGRSAVLEKCFYTKQTIVPAKSELVANYAVFGFPSDTEEEILIDSFSFSVDQIHSWISNKSITKSYGNDRKSLTVTYNQPDDIEIFSNDECIVTINFDFTLKDYTFEGIDMRSEPYFHIRWRFLVPLSIGFALAHKISALICFALDEIVCIQDVRASSRRPVREDSDELSRVLLSVYYGAKLFTNNKSSVRNVKAIFNFQDIADNSKKVTSAWILAYELFEPTLELYFRSKLRMHRFDESRFLALAQALESYHRRTNTDKPMTMEKFCSTLSQISNSISPNDWKWVHQKLEYGNEFTLRKRILDMLEKFQEYYGTKKERNRLSKQIVNTRNDFTHFDERLSNAATAGKGLWVLCMKMEILLQLHLLERLSFTREEIHAIVDNSYRIKEILEIKVASGVADD